ncbi:cytochrome P450 [Nocardia huaxiensis]|uniref:cytochrome P450 n=1 Tax=Nocardia huaxiensis TaxID=2755382 RepID=UPI001E38C5E0|nr:cytochrome P450 [Nocardia huaxiensis]UFS97854.1 cytochrome P450 [Nocardia huaxiensis]
MTLGIRAGRSAFAGESVPAVTPIDLVAIGWRAVRGKSPGDAFAPARERHGPLVRVPLTKFVLASEDELARLVTMNRQAVFSAAPAWRLLLLLMFRKALLQREFGEHRNDRLLIQQVMTPARLAEYADRVGPSIRAQVAACPVGARVDLRALFKRVAMRVALEVFLGEEFTDAEVDRVGRWFDQVVHINVVRAQRARWSLYRFLAERIPRKRAERSDDLMSHLCHSTSHDGDPFTDGEIIHHMIFFLFAAHDTSTITMTNMAYYLGSQPGWQERARAESLAAAPELSIEQLGGLGELGRIVQETLRLRPPVPIAARTALTDTELGGYRIPKGTHVIVNMWEHQTSSRVWPRAQRFDPDRFRAEGPPAAWMPFGGGAHKCIGMYFARMEILTVFHALLRDFEWRVPAGYVLPTFENSLGSSRGFAAIVRRRDPAAPVAAVDRVSDNEIRWGIAPNLGRRAVAMKRRLHNNVPTFSSPLEGESNPKDPS